MPSVHQINHPGAELQISFSSRKRHTEDYYFIQNSHTEGVRLWNKCFIKNKPNSHKRKFIEHNGKFISNLESPQEEFGTLRFWGEYEGFSKFELINKKKVAPHWDNPCAVHRPFYYSQNINDQNTDPYVFGDTIYYAVCKKSKLKNLRIGDLILFGSEFGKKGFEQFHLDTLFIVDKELPSIADSDLYDTIYIESTINRIGYTTDSAGIIPIHTGQKFSSINPNSPFSFIPAKHSCSSGFGRPIIDTVKYGLQKPGARTGSKSRLLADEEGIQQIWKDLASQVLDQGFVLATHLEALVTLNQLP